MTYWLFIYHALIVMKSFFKCYEVFRIRLKCNFTCLFDSSLRPTQPAACLLVVNKTYFVGISQTNLFVIIGSVMLLSDGAAASWIDFKHQLKFHSSCGY